MLKYFAYLNLWHNIHTVNVLKFQTSFSFCSQIICCFLGLEFTKMLVRIVNRGYPDQKASLEAV